ncbi:PleD family two-component system response regulator [Candidatus Omnitrophota bacterium]
MADKIRVLLIDDELDFIEPVAYWLKSKGYEALTINSGEAGIQEIKNNAPDIIFLDINMPGMDGIETLETIRKFDKTLPIIMVTVVKDHNKFSKAKELGSSGFFPKKGSLEELQNLIEVTIRTHGGLKR